VISGEEALMVTGASFSDDVSRWIENVEHLWAGREERFRRQQLAPPARAPRLPLTDAPLIYPNFELIRIVEASGTVMAIDEICSGFASWQTSFRWMGNIPHPVRLPPFRH